VTRVCAPTAVASAAVANISATWFSFFMVLLLGKKAAAALRYIHV
jgi:hypothetical protein